MPLRRAHVKSRNGCRQCKVRRVKCDERAPQCSNCARRNQQCEWGIGPASSARSTASPSTLPNSPTTDVEASLSPAEQTPIDPFDLSLSSASLSVLSGPSSQDYVFGFQDLELMHHYSIGTSAFMFPPAREGTQTLWQEVMPQEATKHRFLMHGILGAAALHIACSRPSERAKYVQIARNHQTASRVRFSQDVTEVTSTNTRAIFGYTGMAALLAFGSPLIAEQPASIDDFLAVVTVLRGMRLILTDHWNHVLADIESLALVQVNLMSVPFMNAINGLKSLCYTVVSRNEREVCLKEVNNLELAFSVFADDDRSAGHPLRWPMFVDEAFLDRLRTRDSMALAILAHFCIFLEIGFKHWYLESWIRGLLDATSLAVDPSWKQQNYFSVSRIRESFITENVPINFSLALRDSSSRYDPSTPVWDAVSTPQP